MKEYDEFIKTAMTRLKKEIASGNINKRLAQKFYFQVPKVENNIHNRINARAKRAAEAAAQKAKKNSVDIKHTIRDAKGALKQYGNQPKTPSILEKIKEKASTLKSGEKALDKTVREAKSRASLLDIGKGRMTLDKYKRASNVDNLRTRPMVDSSRGVMKESGHRIAKMKRVADKRLPLGMKILHTDTPNVDFGTSTPFLHEDSGKLVGMEIEIPSKKANRERNASTGKFKRLSKLRAKESRSTTTRHEVLHEFPAMVDRNSAIRKLNLNNSDNDTYAFGSIGSHENPYVLLDDRKYLKKLSPYVQASDIEMRKRLGENRDMNRILLGSGASKEQLERPFYKNIPDHARLNPIGVFTNAAKIKGFKVSSDLEKKYINELAKRYENYKVK